VLCRPADRLPGPAIRAQAVTHEESIHMMDLIKELQLSLDGQAPQLAALGPNSRTSRTAAVHDAIVARAAEYATSLGIGYGHDFKNRAPGDSTLYVHRSGGKPLGQFLFDQTWMLAHCTGDDGTEQFPISKKLKNGYVIECVLAAESEWNNAASMCDDFLKLLVGKAKFKVFIYNSNEDQIMESMASLKACIEGFRPGLRGECLLISCFLENLGRFHHDVCHDGM